MIMNALLVERESSTASLEVKKIFGLTKKFQKKNFFEFFKNFSDFFPKIFFLH